MGEMMKVLSIVGARPQFVKLAPLHPEISRSHDHVVVHTGQHYDYEMSQVFFEQLDIPDPDHNLGVGSGTHAEQTGRMLSACEKVMMNERPDVVVVYGDTNSTIAGALAASKLHIPVAHVEAGLRSFNRRMPEEINRVLTDHISDLLLCPSRASVDNLRAEGIVDGVDLVGDTMVQTLLMIDDRLDNKVLEENGLSPGEYVLATIHRQDNADSRENMGSIIGAMSESGRTIVIPLHPRTRKNLERWDMLSDIEGSENILLLPPQGFLSFISLEKHSSVIMTDSGGVQKEAFFFRVPCITLRDDIEWVETVEEGWNSLVGADHDLIMEALEKAGPGIDDPSSYGDYRVCARIVNVLESL
jgi:UDP-N-acetylglucosamine 2-epimerase (non-hydrolysing)